MSRWPSWNMQFCRAHKTVSPFDRSLLGCCGQFRRFLRRVYYICTGESTSKADKLNNCRSMKILIRLLHKRELESEITDMYWNKFPNKFEGAWRMNTWTWIESWPKICQIFDHVHRNPMHTDAMIYQVYHGLRIIQADATKSRSEPNSNIQGKHSFVPKIWKSVTFGDILWHFQLSQCHTFELCYNLCFFISSVHSHLFFKVTGFYRPVKPSLKVN